MQPKRARVIRMVAGALLCLWSSAALVWAESEPAPRTGWAQGIVVDEEGRPRGGVVVRAWRHTDHSYFPPTTAGDFAALFDPDAAPADEVRAVSAEDGSYRLEGLLLGLAYTLEAVVQPPEVSGVAFLAMAGAGTAEKRLVVAKGRLVRGRVVDPAGGGVRALVRGWSHCAVSIWGAGTHLCGTSSPCTTRSADDGRFTLAVPMGQGLRLYASRPGERMRGYFLFGPDEQDLELRLGTATGTSLEGRVFDETGAPLVGARIWVRLEHRYDAGHGDWTVRMATSAKDGTYRISNLRPGYARGLAVYLPGHEPLTQQLNLDPVPAGRPWRADFYLQGTRTVKGRVLDEAGAPIPHAWVGGGRVLQSPGPASLPGARCDAEGRFEITGVRTDGGSLAAWADGFHLSLAGAHLRWVGDRPGVLVPPAPAGSTSELEIRMRRSVSFAVQVQDASARAVAGARVTLQVWRTGGARRQAPLSIEQVSDPQGRAVFLRLPPFRAASVTVNTDGGVSVRVNVDPRAEGIARVTLPPRGAVRGRVLDADGAPLAGIGVQVMVGPRGLLGGAGAVAITDPTGAFLLEGVRPGRCTIGLDYQPGGGPSVEVDVKPGVSVPEIALRLVGRDVISGRVLDKQGRPIPDASITLSAVPPAVGQKRLNTGPGGSFRFTHLPKGRYRLAAPLVGLPVGAKPITEVASGTHGLELRFTARAPVLVTGHVVDPSGRPVALADVQVAAEKDGGNLARGRGQVFGGWFRVGAFGPLGTPRVRVSRARGADGRMLNVLPETEVVGTDPDGRLRLRLLAAKTVTGRVVDERGLGLAGVTLTLLPERVDPRAPWPQHLTTLSRADGTFTFGGLRAGTGKISLTTTGVWLAPGPRQVDAGEEGVEIRLQRWRRIAGRVVSSTGAPVARAAVRLWWPIEGRPAGGWKILHTNARGAFVFPQAYPDRQHSIRVTPPAGEAEKHVVTAVADVTPGTENLQIRLSVGLTIAGRVTDRKGRPIAGALVSAGRPRHPNGRAPVSHGPWHATADDDGRYVIRHLPHDIKVELTFRGPALGEVAYFPGTHKNIPVGAPDVNKRLELGHRVRGTVVGVTPDLLKGVRLSLGRGRNQPRSRSRGHAPLFTFDGKTHAFRFDPVRAGSYTLTFVRNSAADIFAPAPLEVRAPGDPLRVEVERAWYVSGRVRGDDVRAYRVSLYRGGGKVVKSVVRDTAGHFRVGPVKDEPVTLVAVHPQKPLVALLEVRRPSAGPFELHPKRGHAISGRIAGLPGKLRGAKILARRGVLTFSAPIAEDGWFKTLPLPAGLWQLEVVARRPRGQFKAPGSVEAGADQVVIQFVKR